MFLHRLINSKVYLEISSRLLSDLPDRNTIVCHLLKLLYSLKQASKIWFDTLRKVLEEIGLRRLDTEHSVYVLLERDGKKPEGVFIRPDLVIAVYIDNIMIISQTKAVISDFKKQLSRHFNIKNMGEASDYLGIEIVQNRVAGTLKIHQSRYCKSLLEKYGMAECNSSNVPILSNTKLTVDNLDKETLNNNGTHCYQLIIESLMYAMQGTQPDLAYAVSLCSQFLSKPTTNHMGIAKQVL